MIEKQIINKLLTNKQALLMASEYDSNIFTDSKCRELFKYMTELTNNNIEIAYNVLMTYLKKLNKFNKFGDEYFLDLMTQQPIYNLAQSLNNMNDILVRERIKDTAKDLVRAGSTDYEQFVDKIIELKDGVNKENNHSTSIKELPDNLDELFNSNNWLPFGLKIIDDDFKGLFNGNLVTIAGQPGAGKTTFAMQVAIRYESLFVSLEMPAAELYAKVLSNFCEIPSIKIETKDLHPHEIDKLMKMHLQR